MINLEWFGPEIKKNKEVDYEWAYTKAALEGKPNGDTYKTYEKMFGEAPKKNVSYWLVRLACYYGALEIGYKRIGKKFGGIEASMLSCVRQLDENLLKNNIVLWRHMWLHDVEPAEFDGRELVS